MKTVVIMLFFFSQLAGAASVIVAKNRTEALVACEKKAAITPIKMRSSMRKACYCIVYNIDFEKAKKLSRERKNAELRQLYEKVVKKCTVRD